MIKRRITHIAVCFWPTDDIAVGRPEIDAQYRMAGYLSLPYHYVVRRNGVIEPGRQLDRPGLIDYPHRQTSINVCAVLPEDSITARYTAAQQNAMDGLIRMLRAEHPCAELEVVAPVKEKK